MKAFIFLVVLLFLKTFAIGSDLVRDNLDRLESQREEFVLLALQYGERQDPITTGGNLTINSDSRIDTLIQIHKEENKRKAGIDGCPKK